MMGDFWGIEKLYPDIDDNKGMSAVIVNSTKGLELFESVADRLYYFPTTVDKIAAGNFTIYKPKGAHKNRELFLRELNYSSLDVAMNKYSSYSKKVRQLMNMCRKIIMPAKNIVIRLR
jgi:hypothetical protein